MYNENGAIKYFAELWTEKRFSMIILLGKETNIYGH